MGWQAAAAIISAGTAAYSVSENQKQTLAADDRRKNAENWTNEKLNEEKARKKQTEEQKAQAMILANQRSLNQQNGPPKPTGGSIGIPQPAGAIKPLIGG